MKKLGREVLLLTVLLLVSGALGGCAAEWVGMKLIFDEASLPEPQVDRDLPYVEEGAHPEKHRYDLYQPLDEGWPTLVFVHGGGWKRGDKDLKAGGYTVYGNVGAFYAGQGIGVAVINYRLQPTVGWRDQMRDVARAVARVRAEVAQRGGDPHALFLAGHSAGAQLAAYTAVAGWPLAEAGDSGQICGVVAVSGAGYDLGDSRTYELGAKRKDYAEIFRDAGDGEDWPVAPSVTSHLDPSDPPFLLFYAGREHPTLIHQAKLLHGRLQAVGIDSRLEVVPTQGHRRIVVTLSQAGDPMTAEVLRFVAERRPHCDRGRGT